MASVLRKRLKEKLLGPEFAYRAYLKFQHGVGGSPEPIRGLRINGALKSRAEWESAAAVADKAHLPHHRDRSKDWDHLGAVSAILENTKPTDNILDAGAEYYSNVLPALFLYGYRNLWGINLGFKFASQRGPIQYEPGDITRTKFPDSYFAAASCLSVIEHGVPLEAFFREMHRVLKPGGILTTSTDYYPTAVDTRGQLAHEAPIKIFTKAEVEEILKLAQRVGFELTGEVDLDCTDKPIRWEIYDLEYSYVLFTLRKR
jgi:SAM-dependent methyltransferase